MNTIFLITQLIISVLLLVAILLQNRGEGLSGAIGGSGGGEFFAVRRGAEKLLFRATVTLTVLFCLNALVVAFWPQIEILFV